MQQRYIGLHLRLPRDFDVPFIDSDEICVWDLTGAGGSTGILRQGWYKGAQVVLKTTRFLEDPGIANLDFTDEEISAQRKLLQKEAVVMAQLHHPNIVKCHGLCVESGTRVPRYVVMERADMSLSQYLSVEGSVTVETLDGFCRDILRAMHHLHSKQVLHSDMKCDNILVFRAADRVTVKLCDFDLSKKVRASGITEYEGGTPLYSAPESTEGHVGTKADLYSFGIMVAEIVHNYLENPASRSTTASKLPSPAPISDPSMLLDAALHRLGPDHYISHLVRGCTGSDASTRWSANLGLLFLEHENLRFLCHRRPKTHQEWSAFISEANSAMGMAEEHSSCSESGCAAVMSLVTEACACSTMELNDSAWRCILDFVLSSAQRCWPSFTCATLFHQALQAFLFNKPQSSVHKLSVEAGVHVILQKIANDVDVDLSLRFDSITLLWWLDTKSDGSRLYQTYLHSIETPNIKLRGFLFPRFIEAYMQDVFAVLRTDSIDLSDDDGFAAYAHCIRLALSLGCEDPEFVGDSDQTVWLETICRCLVRSRDNASIAVEGLSSLDYLLVTSQTCQSQVSFEMFERVVTLVCEVMSRHRTHPVVQEKGCFILFNVYSRLMLPRLPHSLVIATLDVVLPTIVRSMSVNVQWVLVQTMGCYTISNISIDPDADAALVRSGCISRIVIAMDSFIDRIGVQVSGVSVIRNLSAGKRNSDLLIHEGVVQRVLAAMRQHGDVADLQEVCCGALRNLAGSLVQVLLEEIVQGGGIVAVVAAMDRHPNIADLQSSACGALRNLCSLSAIRATVVREGGLRRIIAAMSCHVDDVEVQAAACGALANLSTLDQISLVLVHGSGFLHILSAMDRHVDVASVQEAGCQAIWNASVNRKNQSKLAAIGGISHLFEAMDRHPNDVAVQKAACVAMDKLCADHPDNQVAAVRSGGFYRVLAAIDRFIDTTEVLEPCLEALTTLCEHPDNRLAMVHAGGLERTFAVMSRWLSVNNIQKLGCDVLWKSSEDVESNLGAILAGGGLACLFAAMRAHSDDAPVQKPTCFVLANLSMTKEGQSQIVAQGGLSLVLEALDRHIGVVTVQLGGCCILCNLCGFENNQEVLVSEGALVRIFAAMDRWCDEVKIQRFGCQTLHNLSVDPKNKSTIVAEGGLGRVAFAMDRYRDDWSLQEHCCKLLASLAMDTGNREAILEAGFWNRVVGVMGDHLEATEIQHACMQALLRLSGTGKSSANGDTRFVDARDLAPVFRAMDAHRNNAALQERCCDLLAKLSSNPANIEMIVAEGGLTKIFAAMDTHEGEFPVEYSCCQALQSVSASVSCCAKIAADPERMRRLLQVMKRNVDDTAIQEACMQVIGKAGSSSEVSVRIVDEDGIACILHGMDRHPESSRVQMLGCFALWGLAADCSQARASLMLSSGCVPRVLAALDGGGTDTMVQAAGLGFLRSLATGKGSASEVIRNGGWDQVLSSMGRFPFNADVQEACLMLLTNLIANSDAPTPSMMESALQSVLSSMGRHSAVAEVQNPGCRSLANMCSRSEMRQKIVRSGGLTRILSAFDACGDAVCLSGTAALVNLAKPDDQDFKARLELVVSRCRDRSEIGFPRFGRDSPAESIVESGFIPPLLALLETDSPTVPMQARLFAAQCVLQLCCCTSGNDLLFYNGLIPRLVGCYVRSFARIPPADICEAIWCLASRAETVPELLRLHAVLLVTTSMTNSVDDEAVAKHGCLAIGLIGVSGSQGLAAIQSPDSGCLECVRAAAAMHPACEEIQQIAAAIAVMVAQ